MSVIVATATLIKEPEVQTKTFNYGTTKCCSLVLSCDFGLLFASVYGEQKIQMIKPYHKGDRIVATVQVNKLNMGSTEPYLAGNLLEIVPMTITKSAILNNNIAKNERVVHDDTPVEERKTTRSGKKRIETHYELAAVTDEETETYEEQEEPDNPFVENYSEVPW